MKATNTYLNFDGTCRQAMTFYAKCLNTDVNFTPFSTAPPEMGDAVKNAADRILHSELASGTVVLMASDTLPGTNFQRGNNFAISLTCDSLAEMEKVFAAMAENGTVTLPMHDAFWGGRFGMLTDQFGVSWMLSFRD